MDNIIDQLQLLCGQLGIPLPAPPPVAEPTPQPIVHSPAPPVIYQPLPGIECHCPCDFRNLPVQPGTVQAVITDIPYVREWLPNVAELAQWCASVLKPDGILVTWYSQHHLDECMAALGTHLNYQWIMASPIYGTGSMRWLSFIPRYQVAIVYSKSPQLRLLRTKEDWMPGQCITDIIPAGQRDKKLHPHAKTIAQQQYLVEAFSQEDDLICDTCAGSWTTAEACWHTNRRFIGSDINPECLEMARKRFSGLVLNNGITKQHPSAQQS